jgi:hypothetical protein
MWNENAIYRKAEDIEPFARRDANVSRIPKGHRLKINLATAISGNFQDIALECRRRAYELLPLRFSSSLSATKGLNSV